MSETDKVETETEAELKHIKAEIAALGEHEKSMFEHWEPYAMLGLGLAIGVLLGLWAARL